MQRLTKYKILIEAIRKHIVDETEIELVDVMVSYLSVISDGEILLSVEHSTNRIRISAE